MCRSWYFLYKELKFRPNDCNGCHDTLMMFVNLNNIAILNINSAEYRCISSEISKSDALNVLQNADST